MKEVGIKGVLLLASVLIAVLFTTFLDDRVMVKAVYNGKSYVVSSVYTTEEEKRLGELLNNLNWNRTPQKISGLPEYIITYTLNDKITKVNKTSTSYSLFYLENTNSYLLKTGSKTKLLEIDKDTELYKLITKQPL